MSSEKTYSLAAPIRKTCDLFRLLAGHEVLGLAPGEIAKGIDVPPSWVSQNLPALATTGYVEQVAGTNRWRLGVQFVRIAVTVGTNLNRAKQQLDDLSARYSVPTDQVERYSR
ncbi:IclR family transcriptional regulator [Acidovorax sp. GW101-3H11]|uniref:transcriptional regulator n=1 Tax=Acidovorax sp. GW101-3H11 TaxID=1813946 RepID=UPI0007B51370|nr:transcriptional regulator [Acidovorax sp. GW101-3H11]KZT11674.1 IclR family transcriptional regulator [Acidovorax sp. GW101-3H11]